MRRARTKEGIIRYDGIQEGIVLKTQSIRLKTIDLGRACFLHIAGDEFPRQSCSKFTYRRTNVVDESDNLMEVQC